MPVLAWSEWFSETASIMGTEVSVTLWHSKPDEGAAAVSVVMNEMKRIDETLSPYIDSSELSHVNRVAHHEPVALSAELAHLIGRSLHYYKVSEGAFDITFRSLAKYYDYRKAHSPTAEQRQLALKGFSASLLHFDDPKQTLSFANEFVQIDLGGIAKGYAVDLAIAKLHALGVRHAAVSAGGDSRVLGDKLGKSWWIGIQHPRPKPEQADASVIKLPLSDIAISTSGDYERYFIDEQTGKRVHHIINPKTQRSADSVISVTVIGPNGIDTDALSTSLFIMGVLPGLKLINRLPGFDAVIIDAGGKVHYSKGLSTPE